MFCFEHQCVCVVSISPINTFDVMNQWSVSTFGKSPSPHDPEQHHVDHAGDDGADADDDDINADGNDEDDSSGGFADFTTNHLFSLLTASAPTMPTSTRVPPPVSNH